MNNNARSNKEVYEVHYCDRSLILVLLLCCLFQSMNEYLLTYLRSIYAHKHTHGTAMELHSNVAWREEGDRQLVKRKRNYPIILTITNSILLVLLNQNIFHY